MDAAVLFGNQSRVGKRGAVRANARSPSPTHASSDRPAEPDLASCANERVGSVGTCRHILLIADDERLAADIVEGLGRSGFEVSWQRRSSGGVKALRGSTFLAVVLDLALPHAECIDVLTACRASTPRAPVLVLATQDAAPDRIDALDIGANDYCLKPIDLDDMAARLSGLPGADPAREDAPLTAHGIVLDTKARTVQQHGHDVPLSPREFDLLRLLMRQPGIVRSRGWIEEQLYRWGQDVGSNAVEVHVHHLRRKLGRQLIVTVRGAGYVMPHDDPR